jgi:hypothetical protein
VVRALLKILGGGLVLFIAVAIVQEWQLFSSAWFGAEAETEIEMPHGERQQAIGALRLMLDLTAHLYGSGGDERFAERIPAGAGVLDEVLADIEYLARNHRVQDQIMERLDVVSVDVLAADQLEIRTRELWDVGLLWAGGGGEAEPRESRVVKGRYLLARTGSGWVVEGWAFDEREALAGP